MNICVIGNNLTGLALSKALVNRKINVTIFYNFKKKIFKSSRSIGITKKNVDFLNSQILKINKKYLNPIKQIEIYTEKSRSQKILNFNEKNKNLFNLIKSDTLYKLLKNDLSNKKNFRIKKIKKSNFYNNIIKNEYFDLIINCEKNNILTKSFFSKKINKDYYSDAYTCIIFHQKLVNKKAIQIFTKYGPLAFLPLSNNQTSVVFSIYKQKERISEKKILELIKFYNKIYLIKKFSKIEKVNLKFSSARNYFSGKILLFGDSLHQVHPLAGQGFNMTLRDLRILLNELQNKIDLGLPIDSSLLNEFQKKTKHYNLIYANGMNFIQDFFKLNNKFQNDYSDKIISLLGKNKLINNFFLKVADKGFAIH